MTELTNHPGKWLRPAAAASFDRMEAAAGEVFDISSAGRTVAEQQGLIDDWNRGGPANRPPNLYLPAMPATASPHVIGGGQAVDFINGQQRDWIKQYGAPYGWRFNIDSDIVHGIYEEDRDQHKNDTPAPVGVQQVLAKMRGNKMQTILHKNDNGVDQALYVVTDNSIEPATFVNGQNVAKLQGGEITTIYGDQIESIKAHIAGNNAALKAALGL